jgi:hypothetical protein
MKTKREILLENKWTTVRGYLFPIPNPNEDYDNTFIPEEDALPVIAKGIQEYWMKLDDSYDVFVHDLDDAWEYFLDDYHYEHDKDFDEEVSS